MCRTDAAQASIGREVSPTDMMPYMFAIPFFVAGRPTREEAGEEGKKRKEGEEREEKQEEQAQT